MTDRRSPLWRMIFLLISALALSALVLAAACGDDDDDTSGDDDDDSPTATATTDDSEGNNSGDDDDGDDDGGDSGDDDDSDDPFADIEDFASDSENAEGVVTYTFTSDDDGTTGTWTIYSEGDSSRTDFLSEDGSFITITTPAASYTCTESGGDGFCFEGEGGIGSNPFAGLFGNFASSSAILAYVNAFSDVDVDTSSEDIAGVDASCYAISGALVDDDGTIKWCWADNGLLLLADYELSTSGSFEMRATEFSEDVPSGSFDPPYEITTFGQ